MDRNHEPGHERRLLVVLGLTLVYLVVQVGGGVLTGSLALLADAGHMLTDALGLGMAIAAIRFARRPATSVNTYGFYRAEILAALANAVLLLAVAAWILVEAWTRLQNPSPVSAVPMLVVATGGVAVTLCGVWLLHGGAADSLNVRGAFLEVLGDLFGALGAVVAALVILASGWTPIDPLISALIGILIVPRALGLLKTVIDVLLESAPSGLDVRQVEGAMLGVRGAAAVHDVHLWTITSGFVAMSAHVTASGRAPADVLHDLRVVLRDRFGIEHVTLQVEPSDHADAWACCELDPRCFVLTSREPRAASRESFPLPAGANSGRNLRT
jgi:cobalt-zinc-cadmium efflux system protein